MVRDEGSDSDSTEILNYLICALSKAKSAREWQLILGKALTEKFSDLSSLPDQTSHGELRAETPVGITMLLIGVEAASQVIAMSNHREAVLLVKACLDMENVSYERTSGILTGFRVALDEEDIYDAKPQSYDEDVAVFRMLVIKDIAKYLRAAVSLLDSESEIT